MAEIKESSSGISFSTVLPADPSLRLTGLGCRKKMMFKVYAVGIYVNGRPAGSGEEMVDQIIYSVNLKRAVLLKMAREVGSDQMVEALESSVKPKLGLNGAPASAAAMASLEQFKSALFQSMGSKVKEGTEFQFIMDASPNPTLHIAVKGAQPLDLPNAPDICRALLDVYLGKGGVIGELRGNVAKELAKF